MDAGINMHSAADDCVGVGELVLGEWESGRDGDGWAHDVWVDLHGAADTRSSAGALHVRLRAVERFLPIHAEMPLVPDDDDDDDDDALHAPPVHLEQTTLSSELSPEPQPEPEPAERAPTPPPLGPVGSSSVAAAASAVVGLGAGARWRMALAEVALRGETMLDRAEACVRSISSSQQHGGGGGGGSSLEGLRRLLELPDAHSTGWGWDARLLRDALHERALREAVEVAPLFWGGGGSGGGGSYEALVLGAGAPGAVACLAQRLAGDTGVQWQGGGSITVVDEHGQWLQRTVDSLAPVLNAPESPVQFAVVGAGPRKTLPAHPNGQPLGPFETLPMDPDVQQLSCVTYYQPVGLPYALAARGWAQQS
jgi:hypothetical protein